MTRFNYAFTDKRVSEAAEFEEASAAELRVLMALIDLNGDTDEQTLCERAATSRARVAAAIELWSAAGVIRPRESGEGIAPYGNRITEEFASRDIPGELIEQTAREAAETIRKSRLASLFDELARMLGKTMLTPMEIRTVSALSAQYSLDEEYIATLAAYVLESGNFSVNILVGRAKRLAEEGILTTDSLNTYISEKMRVDGATLEYRRLFGIYDRALTPTEKKYFSKWSTEFCYGTEVVGIAYDITVANIGKLRLAYTDKLLTDWHENGCRTAEQCERRYEAVMLQKQAQEASARAERAEAKRTASRAAAAKPRYGDFDPEEAMRRAIERSYKSGDGEQQ